MQFRMLLSASTFQMIQLASTDKTRGAIQHVLLEPGGLAIATDGHALGVYRNTAPADPADFPAAPNVPDSAPLPDGGILIPADICKAVLKGMHRKHRVSILTNAALWIDPAGKSAALFVTDLDTWRRFDWRLPEGAFPNWRQVYRPEDSEVDPIGVVHFDPHKVMQIMEAAATVCGVKKGDLNPVVCLFNPKRAAFFTLDTYVHAFRGMLMPCSGDDEPKGNYFLIPDAPATAATT